MQTLQQSSKNLETKTLQVKTHNKTVNFTHNRAGMMMQITERERVVAALHRLVAPLQRAYFVLKREGEKPGRRG